MKPLVRYSSRIEQKPVTQHTRHRVLYVEDDQANWEILSWVLAKDFELVRATHAREAFDLLRAQHFDVALMDVQLSGSELNGYDIARLVHGTYVGTIPAYAENAQDPNLRIVFLTGDDELIDSRGEAVLMKPVSLADLVKALSASARKS